MRRLVLATVPLVLLVASCGDDDATADNNDVGAVEATHDEPQPCPIEPGDIIPANYHEVGCVDTQRNGQLTMGSFFNCLGGRRLFSDDVGYGFLGEPLKDDGALDIAMRECDP